MKAAKVNSASGAFAVPDLGSSVKAQEIAAEPRAIHQIFEAEANCRPSAVAILSDAGQLDYGELNARANRLARYLRERGVAREMPVGVCLRRSPSAIVAFLAILKAGGAYLPLDPDYPRDRLAFMLQDTGAAVVITDRIGVAALPETIATVVLIDEAEQASHDYDEANLNLPAGPADLAYIMYTSGSTGRPKGVMIEHRGVTRLVCGADYVSFDEFQRFLLLAPIVFDASTFEIWGPLLNGGSLAIAPSEPASLDGIGEIIRRFGVTTLWLTAGLFNLMVDQNLDGLRQLRQLVAGGDALSIAHCRKVIAQLPDCRLVNGYGPTETTTFAVCLPLRPEHLTGSSVPIGRPINQTQVFLLDEALNPVKTGDAGELCIAGSGVARGYLKQPELTEQKFVTPDWAQADGLRLYRTGDQARYREDGLIEFLGRLDEQVKISGYRIEPNEIACVLREYPGVRDAVVVAEKQENGDACLIAFIAGDTLADQNALRSFLMGKLPGYMIPGTLVAVESIPLTNNGKADRAALLKLGSANGQRAARRALSEDSIEEQIAAIWRDVLNRAEVGSRENFFDLGGDSLRLIDVHSRLRKQLGVKLPITDLFEYPTIEALAHRLRAAAGPLLGKDDTAMRARRQKELLAQRSRARHGTE
jgi:amino acid adenylation domain-containing protein